MQPPQLHTGSLSALNDNELEILRLLASGHTAKSIAARLGRSETAINERLREARRKTGVGSSRDLARMLDAQKIWDKNIDLSKHGTSNENRSQPRTKGFEWTKGRMIMLIALPIAALGLAFTSGITSHLADPERAEQASSRAQSPLVGRWSLDVARLPEDERPVAVTITFEPVADGRWHTLVMVETRDGALRKAESTAALDGVAVPVSGSMAEIDSVSLRQPAVNTLVMTLGKDGAPVSTRVYTVAKDRQSMTETIIWPGSELPKMETTHFRRIGRRP